MSHESSGVRSLSEPGVRKSTGPPEIDRAIAALAARQHGVLSLAQLKDLGLCARAVQKRAQTGRLHRVHRGIYAVAPTSLLTREGRWMAAVLACGPGAALSHRSAAALHGLRPYRGARIHVTVPGPDRRRIRGLHVHRSATLTPSDITLVHGIPTTTVARTLLDLADVVDRRTLERACDQAEITETFDLVQINDQLARNPGRRGASTLRAVLDEHYIGSTETWNDFEEDFLSVSRELGLPDPEVNAWLDLHDGEPAICVDFLWRVQRLAVETDGRGTHHTRQAFERDRRRDQRLTIAGWRPVRITRRQLKHTRNQVRRTLLALHAPQRPP